MQKKTKKRIGVAAMSLVLALAVGATAGTTLAKYITSTSTTSETATVAKWGYTMSANADELFGQKYGEVANQFAKVSDEETVIVGAEGKVVAPGSHGSMTFTINGTAEVNAILALDVKDFQTVVLSDGVDFAYYPLIWSVNGTELNGVDEELTDEDFTTAVKSAVETGVAGIDVEVDSKDGFVYAYLPAGTTVSFTLTIGWEWNFGTEKIFGASQIVSPDYDSEDTLLGLISADVTDYAELPANIQEWLEKTAAKEEWPNAEALFNALKSANNTETEVVFNFSATVVQTQATSLEEFLSD